MIASDVFLTVVLLVVFDNGQPVGRATGFFYQEGGTVYLVTNRHVVVEEQRSFYPDSLRLTLHTDSDDLTMTTDLFVPLYRGSTPLWHDHKLARQKGIDIAVVELNQEAILTCCWFKCLARKSLAPPRLDIGPGTDLMVVGFPLGHFLDTANMMPIARSAMVSSFYGLDFQGKPSFLIDVALQKGMSGSPVFTKASVGEILMGGPVRVGAGYSVYLLGVHSATAEWSTGMGTGSTAGESDSITLSKVWYAVLIDEIVRSFVGR